MTPEELRRAQLLSEGESANQGAELMASVEGLDPSEQVRRLKQTGFGVARPPTPEEMAAREQAQDYPANNAAGFTPPPAPVELDYSKPPPTPGRRGRTRGELKRSGALEMAATDPNVMSAGDTFRGSMNPQFSGDGMSAGDVYRASMGANREPAPTAQEVYGDVDILGTIKRGISSFMNPPPRDPSSTRGGRARADQSALDAIRTVAGDGDEPTGNAPVPVQGQAPVADAVSQAENAAPTDAIESQAALPGAVRLSDGAVDVTGVPYADFTDVGQMPPFPSGIDRSVLPLPPKQGVAPEQGQAIDGAEPGQQSAPDSEPLDRVRIHRGMGAGSRVTDAIVNDPDPTTGGLAGLEGPAGLSDQDLRRYATLQAQGIRGEEAENLLIRQRQVEAEMKRAGAQMIGAYARGLGFVDEELPDGTYARRFFNVNETGGMSFIQTDIAARFEPRLGTETVANMDGSRVTKSVLVMPSVNQAGEIMPDTPQMWDLSRWGSEDQGDQRAQEIYEFVRLARERKYSDQEIQDSLDDFYGE